MRTKEDETHSDSTDHNHDSLAESDPKHPKDSDGDVVLADVDGVSEGEQRAHR